MIIFKTCWWFIKILIMGTLLVCVGPIYLVLLALFPKWANVLALLFIGLWDTKR